MERSLGEAHVRFRTQQSQFASRERFPRIWAGAKIFGLAPKYEVAPITGAAESPSLTSKSDLAEAGLVLRDTAQCAHIMASGASCQIFTFAIQASPNPHRISVPTRDKNLKRVGESREFTRRSKVY
jgi:hypothetical protein